MLLSWFDTEKEIAYAKEVILEINLNFPVSPAAVKLKKNKFKQDKAEQSKINKLIISTRGFAQQHKLNIYKKSKLLNTVKWGLKDAGHDGEFVDEIIRLLAHQLRVS